MESEKSIAKKKPKWYVRMDVEQDIPESSVSHWWPEKIN